MTLPLDIRPRDGYGDSQESWQHPDKIYENDVPLSLPRYQRSFCRLDRSAGDLSDEDEDYGEHICPGRQ